MKEIVVLSGKGGTGKTSIVGSLAALAKGAVLADCDLEALHIGQEVELVVEKVKEDEEGNDIMSFKFKPL